MKNESQGLALALMFFLSFVVFLFSAPDWKSHTDRAKKILIIWIIFWGFPPLVVLWIKGVLG